VSATKVTKTYNKFIATKPIEKQAAKVAKVVAGMSIIDDKLSLLPLEVVFDSGEFKAGDTIYVDGNKYRQSPVGQERLRAGRQELHPWSRTPSCLWPTLLRSAPGHPTYLWLLQ
jgi:hypothetical protein